MKIERTFKFSMVDSNYGIQYISDQADLLVIDDGTFEDEVAPLEIKVAMEW